MNIVYTRHAEEKLQTVEARKFKITKNKIKIVIDSTKLRINSRVTRLIGKLDTGPEFPIFN